MLSDKKNFMRSSEIAILCFNTGILALEFVNWFVNIVTPGPNNGGLSY
jgi:hypothetical protein